MFTEHYLPLRKSNVAEFNSWYLGGLAHELGHGLGFPHDSGRPMEATGIALMGGGNLHYREDKWGGNKPRVSFSRNRSSFAGPPVDHAIQ